MSIYKEPFTKNKRLFSFNKLLIAVFAVQLYI